MKGYMHDMTTKGDVVWCLCIARKAKIKEKVKQTSNFYLIDNYVELLHDNFCIVSYPLVSRA
jgi:hypothetical protein